MCPRPPRSTKGERMGMVQAVDGCVLDVDGREEHIQPGDILDEDHPIVKRTPPDMWRAVRPRFSEEAVASKPRKTRVVKTDDATEQ